MSWMSHFGNPLTRTSRALGAPTRKSLKKSPRASSPELPESLEKISKSKSFQDFFETFSRLFDFRDFFQTLGGSQCLRVQETLVSSGCGFFAYSWKLPAYNGAFLLTIDNFSFLTHNWSFSAYNFSFLLTFGASFLTVGNCVWEGP